MGAPMFSYKKQVTAFTIMVLLILTGAIVLSLDHSGLINLIPDETQTNTTATQSTLTFRVINGTDMNSIEPTISGLTVQFTCNARNVSAIRWDFGDGQGADGLTVSNTYSLPGQYLVEAAITFKNGDKVLDYYYLEIDDGIIYDVEAPGIGHIWTFYTWSLLVSGTFSLIWFVVTFYHRKQTGTNIWPRAFTPELRLMLGFGLIGCYFLAIGFFNGIINGLLTAVGL